MATETCDPFWTGFVETEEILGECAAPEPAKLFAGFIEYSNFAPNLARYDAETLEEEETGFFPNTNPFNRVVGGGDGYVYVGTGNMLILKVDSSTFDEVGRYDGEEGTSGLKMGLILGGDSYLYAAIHETIIKIDPSTMGEVERSGVFTDEDFEALVWGGDGNLYAAGESGVIRKIDPSGLSQTNSSTVHSGTVYDMVWGNGYLFTASSDDTTKKVDPSDLSEVAAFTGHTNNVNAVAWGDGYVYSGDTDGIVFKLDGGDLSELDSYTESSNIIVELEFGGDGFLYVSGELSGSRAIIKVAPSGMTQEDSVSTNNAAAALLWVG